MSDRDTGDELAYPTPEYTYYDGVPAIGNQHFGFSKREIIAKDLMAAMLSNPAIIDTFADQAIKSIAYRSKFAADFLIRVLND